MTTIEVQVPDELAADADALNAAITRLFGAAVRRPDHRVTTTNGHVVVTEAEQHDPAASEPSVLVELITHLARNPQGLGAVSDLLEVLAVRDGVLRHVTDAVASQPLAVGPASAGQIALVDQGWRDIELRYGALDAGGYAVLVGAAATSRSVASKARARGLIGYRRGRKVLFPRFQFDDRGLRQGWDEVVAPLRDHGWDDEDIILWLAAPRGALGRRTPVEALEDGDRELVLDTIRDETAGSW